MGWGFRKDFEGFFLMNCDELNLFCDLLPLFCSRCSSPQAIFAGITGFVDAFGMVGLGSWCGMGW